LVVVRAAPSRVAPAHAAHDRIKMPQSQVKVPFSGSAGYLHSEDLQSSQTGTQRQTAV